MSALVTTRQTDVRESMTSSRLMLSMVFALALVVSAVASLNLALPDIARATGADQTQLQWIVDGYAVVFAGLLLPGERSATGSDAVEHSCWAWPSLVWRTAPRRR